MTLPEPIELFADLEAALARAPDGDDALAAFAALATQVRASLRGEAALILDALPSGSGQLAAEALQREHTPLRVLLDEIEQALRHQRGEGVLGNCRELAAALVLHRRRLEAVLAGPQQVAPV